MKLVVEKPDLSWLHRNGFISVEQVGILWDQLAQKCNALQGSPGNYFQSKNEIVVPPVKGSFLGEPKVHDICIAYSFKNGFNLAKSLLSRLARKRKNVILASEPTGLDTEQIESRVASSTALIVLLTQDCLKQVEVVFALQVAKYYYQHPSLVILVHDAESCFFPGYDEQPESVKEFFSEKAVTFLNCYPKQGVEEIVAKFDAEAQVLRNIEEKYKQKPTDALFSFLAKNESKKEFAIEEIKKRMKPYMSAEQMDEFEKMADKDKDGIVDSVEFEDVVTQLRQKMEENENQNDAEFDEENEEDLTTRLFLSHKRSTGQGIAGRLYEGLKNDYKVFIDSEAKIIVVRELSFSYPEIFPDEWKEVEPVLKSAKELVWLAEYNSACVEALKNFIGTPDQGYRPAVKFFSSREGKALKNSILNHYQASKVLDLNKNILLPDTVKLEAVLDVVLESIPAHEITAAQFVVPRSGFWTDIDIVLPMVTKLPNLKELSVDSKAVDNTVVAQIVEELPGLQKLELSHCNIDDNSLDSISQLEDLRELDVSKNSDFTCAGFTYLAKCKKLEVLKMAFGISLTSEIFEIAGRFANLKEVEFPFRFKEHEDAKKFVAEHPQIKIRMEPELIDYSAKEGCWLPAIISGHSQNGISIHCYGQGLVPSNSSPFSQSMAPLGTHKHEYDSLSIAWHDMENCPECEPLHEMMRDVKFGGRRNLRFVNEWYFKEEEGIKFLEPYLQNAQKGVLEFKTNALPEGIKVAAFMKALFEKVPPDSIRELCLIPDHFHLIGPTKPAAEILSALPNLRFLSMARWNIRDYEVSVYDPLFDAIPASLEEFAFSGLLEAECAIRLATKVSNVKSLYLFLPNTVKTSILSFFKENNNIQKLALRNCCELTEFMLEEISLRCKATTELNLTLNQQLSKQPERVISILQNGFPSLKRLLIDLPFTDSPKFQEFKAARPAVEIVDFAKIYVREVVEHYTQEWFPAIFVSEDHAGPEPIEYHIYGFQYPRNLDLRLPSDQQAVRNFPTDTSNYGNQDFHTHGECWICHTIDSICKDLKFGSHRNYFFVSEWYFETEDGKELLKSFKPEGAENRITFNVTLPDGVKPWGVVRALASQLDQNQSYTLNFPQPASVIPKAFVQPLPVTGIELEENGIPTAEVIKELSQKAPQLTRFVLIGCKWRDSKDYHNIKFPELQHLDLSGCSTFNDREIDGIAQSKKLTFVNLTSTAITDKAIEKLSKNWANLKSLNLRNVEITEKSVEFLCQYCPNIENLNLTLCSNISPSACKLISENLPKLKDLYVPYHWSNTEFLAHLKSSRPDITIHQGTELTDALFTNSTWTGTVQAWYPAIILQETDSKCFVHFYGLSSNDNKWLDKNSEDLAPLKTHQQEYGKQNEEHLATNCPICSVLHETCSSIEFAGSKNYAFVNEWFFDNPDGDALIYQFSNSVKISGKLDFTEAKVPGLRLETIIKNIVPRITDPIKQIILPSPIPPQVFEILLADTTQLQSIYLTGGFTDEHAKLIASKCNSLTLLSLVYSAITDEGLQAISSTNHILENLVIKFCTQIMDKGIIAILNANPELCTLELDYQFKLTAASVKPLFKLSRLERLTVAYRHTQSEIAKQMDLLKQKRNRISFNRGPVFYDVLKGSDTPAWYPCIATDITEGSQYLHCYGMDGSIYASMEDTSVILADPFTHSEAYGALQDSFHMQQSCDYCKQIAPFVKEMLFDGERASKYSKSSHL